MALLLTPVAATIIRMAISRRREYKADVFGALLSGNPFFLSSALEKLAGAGVTMVDGLLETGASKAGGKIGCRLRY